MEEMEAESAKPVIGIASVVLQFLPPGILALSVERPNLVVEAEVKSRGPLVTAETAAMTEEARTEAKEARTEEARTEEAKEASLETGRALPVVQMCLRRRTLASSAIRRSQVAELIVAVETVGGE